VGAPHHLFFREHYAIPVISCPETDFSVIRGWSSSFDSVRFDSVSMADFQRSTFKDFNADAGLFRVAL
jgi:hypothetical protein